MYILEQIGCYGQFKIDKNVFETVSKKLQWQWYTLEDDKHTKYSTSIANMTSLFSPNTTTITTEADTIQKTEHIDDFIKTQTSTSILSKYTNQDLPNSEHKSRMACQYLQQASATQVLPCENGITHVDLGSTESRISVLHDNICKEHDQYEDQKVKSLDRKDLNCHGAGADADLDNQDPYLRNRDHDLDGKDCRQDHDNCAFKIDPDRNSHDIQSNDFDVDVNQDY